jgi:hypothetical protein
MNAEEHEKFNESICSALGGSAMILLSQLIDHYQKDLERKHGNEMLPNQHPRCYRQPILRSHLQFQHNCGTRYGSIKNRCTIY